MIIKIILIYLILAFLWSIFALYKNISLGLKRHFKAFYLNFLLFPKALYYFIKYEL